MLQITISQKRRLRSKHLITQKRVIADVLETVSGGHIQAAYTIQHWPAVEILREIEIRVGNPNE